MTAIAILVVAALILVPGAGAALAVAAPGVISIETRIALAFGLGYALVAGVAILLALVHALTAAAFIAGVVLVSCGAWAALLWRGGVRGHLAALAAQAREAPFTLAAGGALVVAVAATRPLFRPDLNLLYAAPWRYWADGLEVAAAGQVPGTTDQWGTELAPTTSKVVLNAFEGGVSFLLGADPFPPMQGILAVAAVGAVAAFLALGRELGFGAFAPLVPALMLLAPSWLPIAHDFAEHLEAYRAENIGLMVAFSVLTGAIALSRLEVGLASPIVVGLAGALGALTHLIPTLVAGVMLLCFLVTSGILIPEVRRRSLRQAGVALAVFIAALLGIIGLAGGDLGFQGATTRSELTRVPKTVDPARSFVRQQLTRAKPDKNGFHIPPGRLAARYAQDTVETESNTTAVIAVAALAVASVLMALLARTLVPAAVMAWGLSGAILVVALLFSYRYSTNIPGGFGPRRLYSYAALVTALVVPGLLAALAIRFRPPPRAAAAIALTVAAFTVAAAVDRIPPRELPNADAGNAVIEWVAGVVPCGHRMLVNARTGGVWEATTGRPAVLEGMAPFLRPAVMDQVLPLLLDAKQFFEDPRANGAFLTEQRIDYVVVIEPPPWIGAARERPQFPTDPEAIGSLPGLTTVHRDANLTVFATSSAGAPRGTLLARCPL